MLDHICGRGWYDFRATVNDGIVIAVTARKRKGFRLNLWAMCHFYGKKVDGDSYMSVDRHIYSLNVVYESKLSDVERRESSIASISYAQRVWPT